MSELTTEQRIAASMQQIKRETIEAVRNAARVPSPSVCVSIGMDTDGFVADMALLADAGKRSQCVRERLFGLGDLSAHIRCVQVDDGAAASAVRLRFRLEAANGLADLVSAVRAGDFDGDAVNG